MSGQGFHKSHGLRYATGSHGFIFYPKTTSFPVGIYAIISQFKYAPFHYGHSLDESYIQKNTQFDVVNYRVNNNGVEIRKTEEEVDKQSGNQFFYSKDNVYSWWHSPCGDGPIPVTANMIDTLNGQPDEYNYLLSSGIRQVAAFGVYSPTIVYGQGFYWHITDTDSLEVVPRCIYKNGKQIEVKGIPFVNSAPSISSMVCSFFHGAVTLNDNTKKTIDMVVKSTIDGYPTYSSTSLIAQSIRIDCADGTSSIPVTYSAESGIAFPEHTAYDIVDLCLWPWRFNSIGTEVCSLSVRCYIDGDDNVYQSTMVVVRIPISHTTDGVIVNSPIIEEYHYRYTNTNFNKIYRNTQGVFPQITQNYLSKQGFHKGQSSDPIPVAVNYDNDDSIKLIMYNCLSEEYDSYSEVIDERSIEITAGDINNILGTHSSSETEINRYNSSTRAAYSLSIDSDVIFSESHSFYEDYYHETETASVSVTGAPYLPGGQTVVGSGNYKLDKVDRISVPASTKNTQNHEYILYLSVNGNAVKRFVYSEGYCIEQHTDKELSYYSRSIDSYIENHPITIEEVTKNKIYSELRLSVNGTDAYKDIIDNSEVASIHSFSSDRGPSVISFSEEADRSTDNSTVTNIDSVINTVFTLFGYQKIYNNPLVPVKPSIVVNASTTFDFRPNNKQYVNPIDPLWVDTTEIKFHGTPVKRTAYSIPSLSGEVSYTNSEILQLCPIGLY